MSNRARRESSYEYAVTRSVTQPRRKPRYVFAVIRAALLLRHSRNPPPTRHSRRSCLSYPPKAGMMSNRARRESSYGHAVTRSVTQPRRKPRYCFHFTIIFTTYRSPNLQSVQGHKPPLRTGGDTQGGGAVDLSISSCIAITKFKGIVLITVTVIWIPACRRE